MPTGGYILGGIQAAGGLIQSIFGGNKAAKAQRNLENLQTPTTTSNQAISDYYNQALNPYSSLQYKMADQSTGANLASGLNAAQSRGGGLAAIGGLIRQRNNALLSAGASAQSNLGKATQMKAQDDNRVFQINKMLPYQKLANLYTAQAQGGSQMENAGIANAFGGLSTAATAYSASKNKPVTNVNYNF